MERKITVAELSALIAVASMAVEYAPEASSVAASPFIDDDEFKAFKKLVVNLKMNY